MIHDGLMKALNELSEQLDANNEVEVKDEVIQPTNIDVELADGGMLFVESEDGEFVGKRAYLTDEEGNRLFTEEDVEWLGMKSAIALNRVADVARKLSGMAIGGEVEAEKNLGEGQTEDSALD